MENQTATMAINTLQKASLHTILTLGDEAREFYERYRLLAEAIQKASDTDETLLTEFDEAIRKAEQSNTVEVSELTGSDIDELLDATITLCQATENHQTAMQYLNAMRDAMHTWSALTI